MKFYQFINFTSETVVQCDVPVVKNTFVDDGDIQKFTKHLVKNTKCIVSGTNFVYSFSFLRNRSTYPVNSIFSVIVCTYMVHVSDEEFVPFQQPLLR